MLLASFCKFHDVSKLLCIFCPICSCPIRHTVDEWNNQIVVSNQHLLWDFTAWNLSLKRYIER